MQFYRIPKYSSSNENTRTLSGYRDCVAGHLTKCVEYFLNKIQTQDGINELYHISEIKDDDTRIKDVLQDIVRKYNNYQLTENDIRNIINYAINSGEIFSNTKEYLSKLFWSHDLPKDICYKLYDLMTKDKKLVNSTYCMYILSGSFPTELLADALKYDNAPIAHWASENENVPTDDLLAWYQRTGQIEKEDPTKHIIEEMPQKEDEDFKKLKELVK